MGREGTKETLEEGSSELGLKRSDRNEWVKRGQ